MKFGAMLSQNLKKGAKGMGILLRTEAAIAFADRKTTGKTTGRRSGNEAFDANVSNAWSGTIDSCSAGIFFYERLGMWRNLEMKGECV